MKSEWKKIAVAVMLVSNIVSGVPVNAAYVGNYADSEVVTPRYVGVSVLNANIVAIGNETVRCIGSTKVSDGYSASMTMTFEKKENGIWKTQKSWNGTATASGSVAVLELNELVTVTRGSTYRVQVSLVVKNGNGIVVDNPSKTYEYSC